MPDTTDRAPRPRLGCGDDIRPSNCDTADVARQCRQEQIALSPRQIECLQWVSAGKSAADIGAILGLSARTVEDHVAVACRKLGVRTRVQAVGKAIALGLIPLP